MNPADTNPETDSGRLQQALTGQSAHLARHEQMLLALDQTNQSILTQLAQLTSHVSSLTTSTAQPSPSASSSTGDPSTSSNPAAPVREAHIPDPKPYAGDLGRCRGFLLQCSLVFDQKPVTYASDRAKISYVVGLLEGRALCWAESAYDRQGFSRMSFPAFVEEMRRVFDHPVRGGDAVQQLINLRQGDLCVADYAVEFRTMAADSGWNDTSLRGLFANGLSCRIKDELATRDAPRTLEELISLSIKIDNRLRERDRERGARPVSFNRSPASGAVQAAGRVSDMSEEPMQLGRARITAEERLRRIQSGDCLYCGKPGPKISTCPVRPKDLGRQY